METQAAPRDLLGQGIHPVTTEPFHAESAPVEDRRATGRRCGNCLFRTSASSARKCEQPDNTKKWVTIAAWWPGCGRHAWNPNKEVCMRIADITIGERARKDLGDLAELTVSIKEVGLLQPVVVTAEGELIAGQRRLEACRGLGWDEVTVVVAEHLAEAVDRLVAERDENTCRKDMAVSEKLTIGARIEEMKRPEARERQYEHIQSRDSKGRISSSSASAGSGNDRPARGLTQETAALAAEAVGLGRTAYYTAKRVQKYADDPTQPPEVREAARAAVDEMDTTGKVKPAHDRFREQLTDLQSRQAPTSDQQDTEPIKAKGARLPKRAQRASLNSGIATLNGLCQGFATVDAIDPTTTNEEAAQWERDLSSALRVLRTLHKKVKDHRNGNH